MSVVTETMQKRGPRPVATCYRCGRSKEVRLPKAGLLCIECRTSDRAYGVLTGITTPKGKGGRDWDALIQGNYDWIQAKRKGL
jgi:hypothetical protein